MHKIKNNGAYLLFLSLSMVSFFFYFVHQTKEGEVLFYTIIMFCLLNLLGEYINFNTHHVIYVSFVEKLFFITLTILVLYTSFFQSLSVYWMLSILFFQVICRIVYSLKIEGFVVKGKTKHTYDVIRNLLNINDEHMNIAIPFIFKKNIVTSFNRLNLILLDDSFVYKNKKIKFTVIQQVQNDIGKQILDFSDDELQLAEMY